MQLLACLGGYSGLPVDNGPKECVTANNFDHVLCAAWHVGDNSGPHDFDEVRSPKPACCQSLLPKTPSLWFSPQACRMPCLLSCQASGMPWACLHQDASSRIMRMTLTAA